MSCNQNGHSGTNGLTCNGVKHRLSHFNSKGELVYVAPINGEGFVIPDATRKCPWTKEAKKQGVFYPHTTQDW